MTDLSSTIAPKSDQMNADDLISGPMTITVTKVSKESGEQPIAVYYNGDNGKPFKPCKSMRRVLVNFWGKDGLAYVGRSMTLFRDENVRFGGDAVGGIRISHLSHISQELTMPLTASRGHRKPYTVKPLQVQAPAATVFGNQTAKDWLAAQTAVLMDIATTEALEGWKVAEAAKIAALGAKQKEWLEGKISEAVSRLAAVPSDGVPACAACGGTGIVEDADGKGPCADCQGG